MAANLKKVEENDVEISRIQKLLTYPDPNISDNYGIVNYFQLKVNNTISVVVGLFIYY